MTDLEDLVDRYCQGWSAPSPEARERLLRLTLSEDATYCDPQTAPIGIDGLMRHIAQVHQTWPGAQVLRTSRVDGHHHVARFHWHVALPDGSALPEGIDFIELSPDGTRIRRITGFFDPLAGSGGPRAGEVA